MEVRTSGNQPSYKRQVKSELITKADCHNITLRTIVTTRKESTRGPRRSSDCKDSFDASSSSDSTKRLTGMKSDTTALQMQQESKRPKSAASQPDAEDRPQQQAICAKGSLRFLRWSSCWYFLR